MNPTEYLEKVHGITVSHITYNPDIIKEYDIIRGSSHDGTLIFTYENINRCLESLLNKESFFKPTEPNWDAVADIKYEVGDIEVVSEFKKADIPHGYAPCVHETVKIPVRCEYIMKQQQ